MRQTSALIAYNPKDWVTFIFRLHKVDTIRKLFPIIIAISIYSWLFANAELRWVKLSDRDILRNLSLQHNLLGFVISLLLYFVLSYSLFIKKFIFFYVMTLPLGYVLSLGYYVVPVVAFIFYVLTSLELIAEEAEDPFGIDTNDLPTDRIAENIRKHVTEIFS